MTRRSFIGAAPESGVIVASARFRRARRARLHHRRQRKKLANLRAIRCRSRRGRRAGTGPSPVYPPGFFSCSAALTTKAPSTWFPASDGCSCSIR